MKAIDADEILVVRFPGSRQQRRISAKILAASLERMQQEAAAEAMERLYRQGPGRG